MAIQRMRTEILTRRNFMKIVAVAGAGVVSWQLGLFGSTRSVYAARRSQPIMGTVLNLTVYSPDRDQAEEALTKTIVVMQELERKLSRHMADSELARLNRGGFLDQPGSDFLQVFDLSQDLSRRTAGAFDVTMLPLLLLHEEIRGNNDHPDSERLTAARRLVGYDQLIRTETGVRFARPGMGVTFDGIAKGYIVDRGSETLKSLGFPNVYVEAGGDLMVSGLKDKNEPWRIGIRPPRPVEAKKVVALAVSNRAVATSGDYLQSFTPDLRHHHIIDPHRGFSPPELASSTVTAPTVALADGLATALMVLGVQDGLDLIESLDGCEAYLIGKDLRTHHTTGFFG